MREERRDLVIRDHLLAGTRGRLSGGQLSHLLVLHDIPDTIGGEHDDTVLIIQLARGDLRYRDQIRMNLRARQRVREAADEQGLGLRRKGWSRSGEAAGE